MRDLGIIIKSIRDIFKKMIIENLALRQQLSVLTMKVKLPKIKFFSMVFIIVIQEKQLNCISKYEFGNKAQAISILPAK